MQCIKSEKSHVVFFRFQEKCDCVFNIIFTQQLLHRRLDLLWPNAACSQLGKCFHLVTNDTDATLIRSIQL